MLSRALSLATVMLLIGGFAAAPVRAQNLEAGKSPSQIFAGTCTACHKGARGLLKTVAPGAQSSDDPNRDAVAVIVRGGDGMLYIADSARVVGLATGGVTQVDYPTGGGNLQGVAAGPGNQIAYTNPVTTPEQIGRIAPGNLTPMITDQPAKNPSAGPKTLATQA